MRRNWMVFGPVLCLTLVAFGCGGGGSNPTETCSDGTMNQDETDVDCGGLCPGCAEGLACLVDGDCLSGSCVNATCQPGTDPTCDDGAMNQDETDVDCGGAACDGCAEGQDCNAGTDCLSGNCDNGACAPVADHCTDTTMNEDETDVDCGGADCAGCADGLMCGVNDDCLSGNCDAGTCAPVAETCVDTIMNQDETDVDCGGDICDACAIGGVCVDNDDCESGNCDAGTCAAALPTCDDQIMNQDETDVDCGGDICTPCVDGGACVDADDCLSGYCDNNVCGPRPDHCNDAAMSGDETDVDCGGSCPACADGLMCAADGDCISGICEAGVCATLADLCMDGTQNGTETDVDCGGLCPPCPENGTCLVDDDCLTGLCENGVCTISAEDLCPNDPDKTYPGICGCGVADDDTDMDGFADCIDGCPDDADKIDAGQCGCGVADTDTDGDAVADCNDGCPDDPLKIDAGDCGCGVEDTDTDGDLTPDCTDGCPNDADKIEEGQCGCGNLDTDTDGDGTADCVDNCPDDANKTEPGICGCGVADTDTDSDGTPDCNDLCPNDADKTEPGVCGCGIADTDTDGDGTADCNDNCPADPNKTEPGVCGCGIADTDTDGDGTEDCNDNCPADPNKTEPGVCGCGIADTDTDGDGTADCNDNCPADPNKTEPGVCGCGIADTDTDGDGVLDCNDNCPADPNKTEPGICGCGIADTDTDGDGTADCNDNCPADPNKTEPGVCGCGIADTDTDGDGTPDCNDNCPADPNKVDPGQCGCGVADTDTDSDGTADCIDNCPQTANPGQADINNDGIGDACDGCGDDCWGPEGCMTADGHCIRYSCRAGDAGPTFCQDCMGAGWSEITYQNWHNDGYCEDVTNRYRVDHGTSTMCGGAPSCCADPAGCAGGDNAWHWWDGADNRFTGPGLGWDDSDCYTWDGIDNGTYTRLSACEKEYSCTRLGWKYGADPTWGCPPGTRMPTPSEWDMVAPCVLPADEARFDYYHDVATEVGGCNCKWNGNWCGQPSIETIRGGRMCGDFDQLHICVPDNGFQLSQQIDGQTVTCSTVDNSNPLYTECQDLQANGLYFPNGITCGPEWRTQNSSYSDTEGFCAALTGSPQIEVYYVCDSSQPRATWFDHVWGTFNDNGYTQHVRCYYP